jgi:hypothetical protein
VREENEQRSASPAGPWRVRPNPPRGRRTHTCSNAALVCAHRLVAIVVVVVIIVAGGPGKPSRDSSIANLRERGDADGASADGSNEALPLPPSPSQSTVGDSGNPDVRPSPTPAPEPAPAPTRPPPPPDLSTHPCYPNRCSHGQCSETGPNPDDFICTCDPGYRGRDCHDSDLLAWGAAPLAASKDDCAADVDGWVDTAGDGCSVYVANSWCCPPQTDDCNAEYAVGGYDSDRACCASCRLGGDSIGATDSRPIAMRGR